MVAAEWFAKEVFMHLLGQVVEGNVITGTHDFCIGDPQSREILVSVTYQNGTYDVVVLNQVTKQLSRLAVKDIPGARRIGMLLNNISTPAWFLFQTSSSLEVRVHVKTRLYVLVREEPHPVSGGHWIAVGEGKLT